ncbi:MAG: hypothetical protein A2144_03865 [Chloroflexi bacterium RBG_16_50_9]|nr:MAG: hypothetical protein A2144_03865 [Chloroflexi bacterium RBG_16_50_9]
MEVQHALNSGREYYELKACRICRSDGCYDVLDLGYHPLADTFLSKEQLSEPEVFYPLKIQACRRCGLLQTKYVVSGYLRYQINPYCYESSSSSTAVKHFTSLAERVSRFLDIERSGLVVDIGSNVGVLLRAFKDLGLEIMGVDPSPNICAKANSAGVETLNDFFNGDSAKRIVWSKGKAAVITATNVFNHADDLYAFMEAADILLQKKGTLVIEVPYLLSLIANLAYDTIYHEHVSYFSMASLRFFFHKVGYEIFHAEVNDYLGGTLRLFVGRGQEHQPDNSIDELTSMESSAKLHDENTLTTFAGNVYRARDELVALLYGLKREGKKIVGVGAPTKGNTLLNFCRIGTNILDFVSDVLPEKLGRFTPGTHIPIVTDETVRVTNPDYALLLSWNLADEIIRKVRNTLKYKGKFIVPVPFPRII